ncbi:hypothetical protein ACFYW8_06145 [Streptomyces sp. NPDC002742]|uniref:hypothetical protein n=1 Tax=Streptomyces sp. NPDC002742 TaxID=3364663 RepID=UPI0036B5FC9C
MLDSADSLFNRPGAAMWLLNLLFVVIAVVTAFGLAGYGCSALARHGVRRGGPVPVLRALGALAGAVAAGLYAWGLLIIVGALMTAEDGGTNSAPPQSCRTSGWWERQKEGIGIVDYSVSYVPLRFVCETSDGGRYDNGDVPGYVNPAALGFALAGTGFVISAGYAAELRTRGQARRAEPGR